MNREHAISTIRENWRTIADMYFQPAKRNVNREKSYECPLCGHGKNGDGLARNPKSKSGNGLKCFGCEFSGDIIDLCGKAYSLDFNSTISLLAQDLNITIDEYTPTATAEVSKSETASAESETAALVKTLTPYYKECRSRIDNPSAKEYLKSRGISIETARAYWIGFDPLSDPAQSGHPCPRIIIPTSSTHYVGRSIDPHTPKQYAKMNNKGGTPSIFNLRALYTRDVGSVFVTEGVFDALSIIECGFPAIALNSTSNTEKLLQAIKDNATEATLVICLDNDKAGEAATEILSAGLTSLNVKYTIADISNGHKDPNEALITDRSSFKARCEAAQTVTKKPDSVCTYIASHMQKDLEAFKDVKYTGFDNLDDVSGGLYSGLYCIAAISSLGKTTFCHQMADQLAAKGNDVIFFSLEQSKFELVSKSIARQMARKELDLNATSLSIRRGYYPKKSAEAAAEYVAEVGDRLSIIEGNFNCDISFIGNYVRQYVRENNAKPIIFIDYLQILSSGTSQKQSDREMIDTTVTALKRLSRELDLTIFVISSVNRSNYLLPIDFESLKQTGGIEYTCDVVWGLNLQVLSDPIFDKVNNIKERREKIREAKAETPRKIELVCLKNRYGISSYKCNFDYYPANDLYKESYTTLAKIPEKNIKKFR